LICVSPCKLTISLASKNAPDGICDLSLQGGHLSGICERALAALEFLPRKSATLGQVKRKSRFASFWPSPLAGKLIGKWVD